MATGEQAKSAETPLEDWAGWCMPQDSEQALAFIEEAGFANRPGLTVYRTEPDRAIVTDEERGAYTVFAVFIEEDEAVHIYEEPGWSID